MFGLHGGAEWPGMSVDPESGIMVVPSNKYPWILRASYFDKDESVTKKLQIPTPSTIASAHSVMGKI